MPFNHPITAVMYEIEYLIAFIKRLQQQYDTVLNKLLHLLIYTNNSSVKWLSINIEFNCVSQVCGFWLYFICLNMAHPSLTR